MKLFKQGIATIFLSCFALSSTGQASAIYDYEINNPAGSSNAGKIKNVTTSYNDATNIFTWEHTVKDRGAKSSDGFWLVVSPGPNPKTHEKEYAIFYGDSDAGILTAYEYSGANKSDSWNTPGNYLASFGLGYSHTGNKGTFSFSIDTTDLNDASTLGFGPSWVGAAFGEQIGVWLHPMLGADFDYKGDEISALDYDKAGWYDTAKRKTNVTEVSEPTTLGLIGIVLAGLAFRHRKTNS